MKVFIVEYDERGETAFFGVFSTFEKAQERFNQVSEYWDVNYLSIYEYELDQPYLFGMPDDGSE